jgi:hypothetical protein
MFRKLLFPLDRSSLAEQAGVSQELGVLSSTRVAQKLSALANA